MSRQALLVAHGSPDPRSSRVVSQIAEASGATASFLGFDQPNPMSILAEWNRVDHRTVDVVPLLLSDAYHSRVDMPKIVDEARQRYRKLDVTLTPPIGGESLLPALARGAAGGDAVVLAAAGTADTAAVSNIAALAEQLGNYMGLPCVAGYAATARPTTAQAVHQLRERGATRVTVASYFIAPGRLHDRVHSQAMEAGAHSVAGPLGSCAELVARVRACYSMPISSRADDVINKTMVPTPRIHAATANHHSPA